MSDPSTAGVQWLENVSGQQNSRNTTVIVGTALLILAASVTLIVVIVFYRRLRYKRHDEEALWAFVTEKRRTLGLFPNSNLDKKQRGPEQDANPNWVPFCPPVLPAVPHVHLRSSPTTQRPFLRPMYLGKPSTDADLVFQSQQAPAAETTTEPKSQPAERPTQPRSPPRLTVTVPPPVDLAPSAVSPSPSTVKFLPGPPSSSWRAEARGRWERATQVLRSPLTRTRGNNTPVTASFLEGGSKKKKVKAKAVRRVEVESEFWSAGANTSEELATKKLEALILDMKMEYDEEL